MQNTRFKLFTLVEQTILDVPVKEDAYRAPEITGEEALPEALKMAAEHLGFHGQPWRIAFSMQPQWPKGDKEEDPVIYNLIIFPDWFKPI